jgi:cell filamentation protein
VPGYTVDNSPDGVLKNKLGAASQDELERREADYVHRRALEFRLGSGPKGRFDAQHLQAIHKHLFQDVYEWAGHTRDERIKLSDGAIATEPVTRKADGKDFLAGPLIPDALDQVAKDLREADYLRGLQRQEFAIRAADVMSTINGVHPFREGNGRVQRVFIEELARQAGHSLDFTVVSQERMIQASVAAHEHDDSTMMRRLFDEISNPSRVAALREATEALERHGFDWNDRYIATLEPGHRVEIVLAGAADDHFMARTSSEILIGKSSDLPDPQPERGESFAFVAPEHCWGATEHTRTESRSRDEQNAADEASARREAEESQSRSAEGEMTAAKEARNAVVRETTATKESRESLLCEFGRDSDPERGHENDGGRSRGR